MIEYSLQDINGLLFELNGDSIETISKKSLTIQNEDFNVDSKVEENSFLAGSIKIGDSRLEAGALSFVLDFTYSTDSAFNLAKNTFLYELAKAVYLIDVTNDKRISVTFSNASFNYDSGSLKRSGKLSFVLTTLTPYWEDNTEQEQLVTTVATVEKELVINNTGFLNLFPTFEILASALCDSVEFIAGVESIKIEDTTFGSINNETMIVNNDEGFVSVNNVDRTKSITGGLGFISIPVGISELQITTEVACDIKVQYRKRYYV